ncbi:MAG: hypothetical protein IPL64_17235 [Flavobacteriales bacterium]|nr:hypothetical protein [Flavobacteriales bacterium]
MCFIPDNDYRGFLKRREPEATAKLAHGVLVNTTGELLGEHDGYPFFTIGQRKGLGIATGEPLRHGYSTGQQYSGAGPQGGSGKSRPCGCVARTSK